MFIKNKKAFSLIELLIVVLILSVLATLVVPRIAESSSDAKKAKCDTNVAAMNRAVELYAVKNGAYPADQSSFDTNVKNSATTFPHGLPVCPFSTSYVYNATTDTCAFHSH